MLDMGDLNRVSIQLLKRSLSTWVPISMYPVFDKMTALVSLFAHPTLVRDSYYLERVRDNFWDTLQSIHGEDEILIKHCRHTLDLVDKIVRQKD